MNKLFFFKVCQRRAPAAPAAQPLLVEKQCPVSGNKGICPFKAKQIAAAEKKKALAAAAKPAGEVADGASASAVPGLTAEAALDAEGHNWRGKVHFAAQEYVKAVEAYGQAILLAPKESKFWLNRSIAHRQLKNWPEAEVDAMNAVKLVQQNAAKAHYSMAQALSQQGKVRKALEVCETGLIQCGGGDKGLLQLQKSMQDELVKKQKMGAKVWDNAANEEERGKQAPAKPDMKAMQEPPKKAPEIEVSGAGDALANGMYTKMEGKTQGFRPIYAHTDHEGYKVAYSGLSSSWVLTDPLGAPLYHTQERTDRVVPRDAVWTCDEKTGVAPVPSVTAPGFVGPEAGEWVCPKCGDVSPPTFRTCFKCGTAPPKAGSSEEAAEEPCCPGSAPLDHVPGMKELKEEQAKAVFQWKGRSPSDSERRFLKTRMLDVLRKQYESIGTRRAATKEVMDKNYSSAQKSGLQIQGGHSYMPPPDDVDLPADHKQSLGVISLETLESCGKPSEGNPRRLLISVYGDVFDVSARPDKYGVDGPYSIFAGRDISWGLVSGADTEENCNRFYDIFKLEEHVTQKMQGLCGWLAFYEHEYGVPVAKLDVFLNENELPAPPTEEIADCSVM